MTEPNATIPDTDSLLRHQHHRPWKMFPALNPSIRSLLARLPPESLPLIVLTHVTLKAPLVGSQFKGVTAARNSSGEKDLRQLPAQWLLRFLTAPRLEKTSTTLVPKGSSNNGIQSIPNKMTLPNPCSIFHSSNSRHRHEDWVHQRRDRNWTLGLAKITTRKRGTPLFNRHASRRWEPAMFACLLLPLHRQRRRPANILCLAIHLRPPARHKPGIQRVQPMANS